MAINIKDCIDFTILNKNMCLGDECMAPRCLYIHGKYFRLLMFAKIFFSETITPKITNVNLAKSSFILLNPPDNQDDRDCNIFGKF